MPEFDPGHMFDDIVYRGTDATLQLSEEEGQQAGWEILAMPGSNTPPHALPDGALVVRRALGEGRLGCLQVLGRDLPLLALYRTDGRIRLDIVVLVRRESPRRLTRPADSVETADGPIERSLDEAEAVPMGGRGSFRHDPLGGETGDNVEARWNVGDGTAAAASTDVVVHLHGYGAPGDGFLARKAAMAGVDFVDSSGTVSVRAGRPTLALIPRGVHKSGSTWLFDNLATPAAFNALIDAGLSWLATTVLRLPSGSTCVRGRLTLMAHSGGGAGMGRLLDRGVDPDEVVCFDSLYGGEGLVQKWADRRLASPSAAQSGLRAFYTGCGAGSWSFWNSDHRWHLISTEVSARRLQAALDRALAKSTAGAALVNRFRVQYTSVAHNDIPGRYSPLLLERIDADVPGATATPARTVRPACVANDDWLTTPPQRPGGDAPPASP